MKYLVVLCDGMADVPNEELNGKTPMQVANKPCMDTLCKTSEIGMCKTVGTHHARDGRSTRFHRTL